MLGSLFLRTLVPENPCWDLIKTWSEELVKTKIHRNILKINIKETILVWISCWRVNSRNKWRKYTRCYALTKFLSIVEFAPRCSRQNKTSASAICISRNYQPTYSLIHRPNGVYKKSIDLSQYYIFFERDYILNIF